MKTTVGILCAVLSWTCSFSQRWKNVSLVMFTPDNAAQDITIFVTTEQDTIFYHNDFETFDGQYAIGFTMPADRCCQIHFRNPSGTGLGVGGSFLLYDVNEWTVITASLPNLTYSFDGDACACQVCSGQVQTSGCPTDLNGDGLTNVSDLSEFLANFGASCD